MIAVGASACPYCLSKKGNGMYTAQDIFEQLSKMNAPRDRVVLMHTALRTVGDVAGGGEGLLDVMIEYFTAKGGLFCVPTHTWANWGSDRPTLDLSLAESNLGVFSRLAEADPRGIRSENPTHSMVVFGDRARAEAFVADDAHIVTPTAPDSCYGKLYREGGLVLLVGVGQCKNTYLHAVAEILALPNRMEKELSRATVRKKDGSLITRDWKLFDCDFSDDISHRFPKYEQAFRYHRCITDGFVGDAPAQLCDARGMKSVVEGIFAASNGRDPLADESPIPPKLYCRSGKDR